MKKEAGFKESWNKKRIFIASFLLVILIGIGLELNGNIVSNFLEKNPSSSAVKGIRTYKNQTNKLNFDFGATVSERLEAIRQDAENIDISEIATSSPQIQKIIKDIKNLQNFPNSQLKEACFNICKGL